MEIAVAAAQSPALMPEPAGLGRRWGPRGGVEPWQILFFNRRSSNSSLVEAQNRWAVVAVVLDLALRDSLSLAEATVPPELRPWLASFVVCSLAVLVLALLWALAAAVRGSLRVPPAENPFLVKDETTATSYGSTAAGKGDTTAWETAMF